ncbi:hypothetical protein LSAT2_012858 [Lamellibrachia satsuma]|nr:hypothetical protein LSAT2_012858 [Lamellibrachia satsuma]
MPPIKESTQQTAGASAPLDLPTQSDEVDPGLEQVSATACISGAGAANTARCGWETDMEKRTSATEQGMSATEQGMSATEQGMSATEQRMSAAEQGISSTEQRMSAAEQGISATEQRMRATEQFGRETRRELRSSGRETRRELGELGRETRRELGEMRELLQAALPNAANVAAATASCSQEATMATINTGIVGCLNVLPIEAQGIKFGVVTISLHVRVSEKISDNLACTLKFDHVSTIASEINVKQQGFSAWGWREPAVHVGSRPNAESTIFL